MSAVNISPAKPFSLQPASQPVTSSQRLEFPFLQELLIHPLDEVSSAVGGPVALALGRRWVESYAREASPASVLLLGGGGRHQGSRGSSSQPCQISDQKCRWGGPGLAKVRARANRAPSHSSGPLL